MAIRQRVLSLAHERGLSDRRLAHAMGVDPAIISEVRNNKLGCGPRFIEGALRAFPDKCFHDLFTLDPDREPVEVPA